ncbi:ankyrin repeat-containing protein ITN1-like isoform X2 [Alnus glutinosa]|uniref:ankyrin repeat-containing protein ITN1-like isoform X2 n=1 Tax=Alnus glutinosa TaxID=3517 RepID=UPI002D7792E0|nr:ankyrin repeat-containing protein ITN1-like isoform X2 [Alnus glutinosa]
MEIKGGLTVAALQVLDKHNYVAWTVRVKTYLMAYDLWDLIEGTTGPPSHDEAAFKAWSMKNSTALNVIQISCGPDTFSKIIHISSVKIAWDTLAKKFLRVLEEDNYVDWSVQIKTYLKAHDLWEIIEATTEPPREDDEAAFKAWSKKNSTALHVIKISCGTKTDFEIIQITSAKTAWDMLAEKYAVPTGSDENGNVDYVQYEALREALKSGDWNAVEEFLQRQPDARSAKITFLGQTALHLAVIAGHECIVEKLVDVMSVEDLAILDTDGNTALPYAISAGNYKMTACMIGKNNNLVSIKYSKSSNIPANRAFYNGHTELAGYLYSHTPLEHLTQENAVDGATVCTFAIYSRCLDSALDLIRKCPRLALAQDNEDRSPLYALADMPNAFPSGDGLVFWKRWIYNYCIYIQPAWATKEIRLNIQDVEKSRSDQIKFFGSGMTGASILLNRIPGAALQMQKELQWFKEVESIGIPRCKEYLNTDGLTPRELFTKNHIDLKKEGEKWMKGTATSCTVVGALIVTIMFAAAFTVPGGNNQDTGFPVFLDERLFMLFIISDALSLFSSTTSVVMFLGILTSRYAEDDFLESLPRKMIIGLSTLFFSIAAMMIAFSTALLIMLQGQYSWIIIPVICLASVPVTLFILMQFPLLVDMCMSTYGPGIFDKKMGRWV